MVISTGSYLADADMLITANAAAVAATSNLCSILDTGNIRCCDRRPNEAFQYPSYDLAADQQLNQNTFGRLFRGLTSPKPQALNSKS